MTHQYDYVVIGGGIVGSAIATGLAAKGRSVALIERGGATIASQVQAVPTIKCPNRLHSGAFQARNHVLGGNGHYWGGGLIRPPDLGLFECLGISERPDTQSETLASNFSNVERGLNIGSPPSRVRFPLQDMCVDDCDLSEILVLPGRSRNTAMTQLEKFKQFPICKMYVDANVVSFSNIGRRHNGNDIGSVIINQAGNIKTCTGRKFVIANGVVDSNLMVLANAHTLGFTAPEVQLADKLHDHLSVPIARVSLSSNRELKALLAPQFRNGLVVGHHFELRCKTGWGAQGFLHFAMQFDELSPYREIKHLLLLRQQRATFVQLANAALPILAATPDLFRIAVERTLGRRLYLADGLTVTATLDFESFPHLENRLQLVGDSAEFEWKITDEDDRSFLELLGKANRLLEELADKCGMVVESLVDSTGDSEALAYFHKAATDAYHLGGGLAARADGNGAVDQNLRLAGTTNVFVVSAAVFSRPGVGNPTHTLLALADRFVCQQLMGERDGDKR